MNTKGIIMQTIFKDFIKEFISNKTNQMPLIALVVTFYALPINVYFLKEVNMVNLNFLFKATVYLRLNLQTFKNFFIAITKTL